MNKSFYYIFFVFLLSCRSNSDHNSVNFEFETLMELNNILQKTIDEAISDIVWTDKKHGSRNSIQIKRLNQLAKIRKEVNLYDSLSIKSYINKLQLLTKSLNNLNGKKWNLDYSFQRVNYYYEKAKHTVNIDTPLDSYHDLDKKYPIENHLLTLNLRQLELQIVKHISNGIGISDCCFASKFSHQIDNDTIEINKWTEIIISPSDQRNLWRNSNYDYANIKILKDEIEVPTSIEKRTVGNILILKFMLSETGEYKVTVSITENGTYIQNNWTDEFVCRLWGKEKYLQQGL